MSEQEIFFSEFEVLGEAEVEERLAHSTFDNIRRAYALRWLNQKGFDRLRGAEREAAARKADLDRMIRRGARVTAYARLAAVVPAVIIVLLVIH